MMTVFIVFTVYKTVIKTWSTFTTVTGFLKPNKILITKNILILLHVDFFFLNKKCEFIFVYPQQLPVRILVLDGQAPVDNREDADRGKNRRVEVPKGGGRLQPAGNIGDPRHPDGVRGGCHATGVQPQQQRLLPPLLLQRTGRLSWHFKIKLVELVGCVKTAFWNKWDKKKAFILNLWFWKV